MRGREVWGWLALTVILVGLGFTLGWYAWSDTDTERALWNARTDSLLSQELRAHRAVLDSVAQVVAVVEQRATQAEANAERERRARVAAAAREASLAAELASARTGRDSLVVYPALLAATRTRAERAEREAGELGVALAAQQEATAALRVRATADSTRIVTLERQLGSVPKPKSACRLGPLPCPVVVVGLGVTTGTGTAAGVSVTAGFPIRR